MSPSRGAAKQSFFGVLLDGGVRNAIDTLQYRHIVFQKTGVILLNIVLHIYCLFVINLFLLMHGIGFYELTPDSDLRVGALMFIIKRSFS